MAGKKRLVIIGNGAAGIAALDAIRRVGCNSTVTMIDRESVPAYSRITTPYFIKGAIPKEKDLYLRSKAFYQEPGIRAVFGSTVEGIDTRERTVILDRGRKEPFDLLLIAGGASPKRPVIPGVNARDLLVLRDLADARKLKKMRDQGAIGVFIGAGLVSLQTLQAMHTDKSRSILVVKSDRVLSQTLDAAGAQIIEKRLLDRGVRVMKGCDIHHREKDGTVVLDTQERLRADFIFAGKGVRPNTDFLEGSGILADSGILVNRRLETNIEGIYAAGDAVRAPDFFSGKQVTYGLWPSALEQGEIAGKNMAGRKVEYEGNLRMNVSTIFGLSLASVGDLGSERVKDVWVTEDTRGRVYRKLCLDEEGVLIGAVLINRMDDIGVIQGIIRARRKAESLAANSAWKSLVSYGLSSPARVCSRAVCC
ncbi:MAG: NAD(P)/FAD-dependent oxidoreductase [Syntrophales bacterium]